jgi:hypothetical protein
MLTTTVATVQLSTILSSVQSSVKQRADVYICSATSSRDETQCNNSIQIVADQPIVLFFVLSVLTRHNGSCLQICTDPGVRSLSWNAATARILVS